MFAKPSDINYELITKYLAGEASVAESEVVTQWRNASESNRHAFAQMEKLWNETGKLIAHEEAKVDVDSAWNQFKGRIHTEKDVLRTLETPEKKTRSLFFYISRAAAVLVIGIVFYLVYQNKTSSFVENTEWVTSSEILSDTLPDGSLVALNTRSALSFPQKFDSDKRKVVLKGEAIFQVEHNPQKPFVVEVEGAKIIVLGTAFYVQAYDSLDVTEVGVEKGKVKVVTANSFVILEPGERISIERTTEKISPIASYDPNDLYWQSKTLVFQDEDLATVYETLERNYNVDIRVENKRIFNCRLTAKFYNEDIDHIFEIINTNFNLTSQNENQFFIVSGDGCD